MMAMASVGAAQPCEWRPLDGGTTHNVNALAVFEGDLYIGGAFGSAGGIPGTARLARWDGEAWSAVGSAGGPALGGQVNALLAHGDSLYVGGAFISAGGIAGTSRIARWDGSQWSPLATGVDGTVYALAAHDGFVYTSGSFSNAGPLVTNRIARWNPATQAWGRLSIGIVGSVYAIQAFQGEIYAGGFFVSAGGGPADNIARWNPATTLWSAASAGVDSTIRALAVFDDGQGPALFAGGGFTLAGGQGASYFARWDGAAWSVPAYFDGFVFALAAHGGHLYAGGAFDSVNGIPASRIARWDPSPTGGWLPLDGGVGGGDIFTLLPGPTLPPTPSTSTMFVGGSFTGAGGPPPLPAARIAAYRCESPTPACYANCDGSTTEPILNVDDFTCFINEYAAAQTLPHEQQIASYANCDNSTTAPALNVDDFTCFINEYAAGCP
jgi:trimeric autotransporter adhesin